MKSLRKWLKGFHPSAAKTHLKMSISRAKSQQGKCVAQIKMLEREVGMFLREHREDKARIKVEQLIHQNNMDKSYDLLCVWCELIATRINFLDKTDECPADMVLPIMSTIYAQGRCEVPELALVTEQFMYKYGQEWIKMAMDNTINEVDKNLIMHLSVKPPSRVEVTQKLVEIAGKYRLDWEPDPRDLDGLPPPPAGLADIPTLPPQAHQVSAPSNTISVTVPSNYKPGTPTMSLMMEGGREIVINVPLNTMPGQQMLIPISAVAQGTPARVVTTPIPTVYQNPPAQAPNTQVQDSPPMAPSAPSAPFAPSAPLPPPTVIHQPHLPAPATIAVTAIPPPEAEDIPKWSELFGWLLRDGNSAVDDRVKTDIFLGAAEYVAIFFFAPGNATSDARVSVIHGALERLKGVKCEVIGIHTGDTCKDSDFAGLKFCTVPCEDPKRLEMWEENKDMVKVGDIVLLDQQREVVTPMAGDHLGQDPQLRHFPWRDGVPEDPIAPSSGSPPDEFDDLLSRFENLKK